jgi:radical SAM superfamily enzyme YgiQ (UPF0313 family)
MVFSKERARIGDEATNPWMGVLYLAAYLEKNGFSVKVYDPGAERLLLSQVISRLKRDKPKVVGLSALTSGIKSATEIAKAIRENFGNKIVIGIGGSHINVDPNFIKRHPYFDFEVVGEGEITLTKIVKAVKAGKKLTKEVYQGELVKNLDDIPFPARHLIDIYNYFPIEKQGSKEKPTAAIVGSRGCPYLCSFCSRNPEWRTVRFRSAKNIVDEMERIAKNYDGKFSFTDDAITLNRKIAMELCREIIKRGCHFRWLGMTRANCVDDELLAAMKKAGCEELFLGVESGNLRVRNQVIRKNLRDGEISKAIKLCQKHEIRASVFLMLGFPSETKRELEDTVNFGLRFQPDFIGVHLTLPLPGSEVFEIAVKERKIPADLVDKYVRGELGEGFVENWPVYIPKGMNQEYLVEAKKRAYRKFYLSQGWIIRRLKLWLTNRETLLHDLGLVKTGVHVLVYGRSKNAVA